MIIAPSRGACCSSRGCLFGWKSGRTQATPSCLETLERVGERSGVRSNAEVYIWGKSAHGPPRGRDTAGSKGIEEFLTAQRHRRTSTIFESLRFAVVFEQAARRCRRGRVLCDRSLLRGRQSISHLRNSSSSWLYTPFQGRDGESCSQFGDSLRNCSFFQLADSVVLG